MKNHLQTRVIALAAATLCSGAAQAITFEGETVSGNFDSTVSLGVGVRASKQSCGLIIGSSGGSAASASGPSAPGGCADALSSLNDQGDLNYNRGDRFTTYLKGTHELLLNMPEDVKFLGRVSWLRDYSATRSTGNISGANTTGRALSDDATNELHSKVRLLD
uniref:DUF1302 family protein n=2 Tax=Oxalobacteraceae TaxID=75682 RepID=UPI003B3A6F2B